MMAKRDAAKAMLDLAHAVEARVRIVELGDVEPASRIAEPRGSPLVLVSDTLPALAKAANEGHLRVEQCLADCVVAAGESGAALIAAKERLWIETGGNGQWLTWIATNCLFSERTAQYYMDVARNPQRVAGATSLREALRLIAKAKPKKAKKAKKAKPKKAAGSPSTGLKEFRVCVVDQVLLELTVKATTKEEATAKALGRYAEMRDTDEWSRGIAPDESFEPCCVETDEA
jgi:hypothetical protein